MRYILMVLVMFFIVGCSNVSKVNYDKIQMGMPYAKVIDILGKADKCDALAGMSDCTWGDEKRFIKVKFIAEKVIFMHSQGLE